MNQVSIIGELISDPKTIKTENEDDLKISLKVKRNCSKDDNSFDIINIKTTPSKLKSDLIFKKGNKFIVNGKMISLNNDKDELISEIYASDIFQL